MIGARREPYAGLMIDREQDEELLNLLMADLYDWTGMRWRPLCWLDDIVRRRPAPDALLSDGLMTMAVEIKRLTFIGHKFEILVATPDGHAPSIYAHNDGFARELPGAMWGEVTQTGLMVTDIDVCTELTISDAVIKFVDADWADSRAVLLHMTPTGYGPDETITDTDYWSEEEFVDALGAAALPSCVDLLFGATAGAVVVRRGRLPVPTNQRVLPGF